MREQEKKRQRIYNLLNAKTKPKFSEIIGVSVWPSSSPDLNPLDFAIWGVLEKMFKKCNFPSKYQYIAI